MYPIVRLFSLIIRWGLCYVTIDKIPIMRDPILNEMLLEVVSLYTVLWAISYFITGLFYSRGENPTLGVLIYLGVYLLNLGIMFLIMLLLTFVGIFPF